MPSPPLSTAAPSAQRLSGSHGETPDCWYHHGAWSRRCGWVSYHRLGRRWEIDTPRMAMLHLASRAIRDRGGLWRTDLAAQRRGARSLQEASMLGRKQKVQETTPTERPSAPPVTL